VILPNFIDGVFMNPLDCHEPKQYPGVVVFAVFLGIAIVVLGEKSQTILKSDQ
jgi:Na+/H+-dicarboxylate symporter